MIAYTRGVKGSVVNEEAIAFLFNASPSVVIPEGGMGAGEAPKMDAEAFASYILEKFKLRVAKSSRKPWDEANDLLPRLWIAQHLAKYFRDADYIRRLSETVAYPDKLDFNELMNMWLSLPRRERKKARRLVIYKIMEYATEEFLKSLAESARTVADLRRDLLRDLLRVARVAQAFVNKNVGLDDLIRELKYLPAIVVLRMYIYGDPESNLLSFSTWLENMLWARKDKLMKNRLRELVKKYIVDELTTIENKKEEEEEEDFDWDEDPYSIPCSDEEFCKEMEEDHCYENFDDECSEPVEDYYDYDNEDDGP